MLVMFTAVFAEEGLETVAEASCEEISTILPIGMYAIISLSCWMTVNVLKELLRENVRANRDLVHNITRLEFITEDFVAVFSQF